MVFPLGMYHCCSVFCLCHLDFWLKENRETFDGVTNKNKINKHYFMIQFLKNIYGWFYSKRKLDSILKKEKYYLSKYNGYFNTNKDAVKTEYNLRIRIHGIEKGFSFRTTKPAFGRDKIMMLLEQLDRYSTMEGHKDDFVIDSLSTVKYYIDTFRDDKIIKDIKEQCEKIEKRMHVQIAPKPATLMIQKETVDAILSSIDYESFIASRHSYRFYSKEPVSKELLRRALKIAEHTPTACNRQGQKVYVFTGENKDRLLNIGPSRGFVTEVNTAILITVDMRAYFGEEFYQCYVDGGLYAMNLINAIHSTGLGCIPLTAGMYAVNQREELCKKLNIPENEAPIITIGVGNREPSSQVNASYRKDYNEYTSWR